MEKEVIIKNFINNFILKERQDRTRLELSVQKRRSNFSDKLNHQWDKVLDMKKLKNLPKAVDDYEYVKNELGLKDNDLCYLISNYDDIDNKLLEFKTAFEKSYSRGFATLIINKSADKLFLETEEIGHQYRFTGQVK